ncbi:hypothetical protein AVEN_46100-1 [Araneus ventricosus]|uniref:Uncharacterized protein n=1 Tax=Araneus ventricosus TaxID=182803 RepID=A0A4Y2HJ38_ARAVE|nr:hypothetical protein AVEN_46100-1 [Araneus ventricosus]
MAARNGPNAVEGQLKKNANAAHSRTNGDYYIFLHSRERKTCVAASQQRNPKKTGVVVSGYADAFAYVEPLTYLELYSRRKAFVNISWRHPPAHSWYRSEGPGVTIHFKGDRKDQTALARLTSDHLKTLRLGREP